jgi:hypothetical protein
MKARKNPIILDAMHKNPLFYPEVVLHAGILHKHWQIELVFPSWESKSLLLSKIFGVPVKVVEPFFLSEYRLGAYSSLAD